MKRFISTAAAIAVMLGSSGIANAATTSVVALSSGSGCDVAAALDGQPYFEMPTVAADEGASGTTAVRIDLAPSGDVTRAEVFSSSGNAWLDAAAIRSAHLSRFAPESSNCKHIGGSYLYVVQF